MGRNPDYFITDAKNKKVAVYKTPFTKNDYNFIINQDGCGERFGIHDGQDGEIKFYNIGNGHVPTFRNIFNLDFDMDFFKTTKYLGLGVVAFWAFRLSRVTPSNPLKMNNQKTRDFMSQLFAKHNRPSPEPIIHNGEGKGFSKASEYKKPINE